MTVFANLTDLKARVTTLAGMDSRFDRGTYAKVICTDIDAVLDILRNIGDEALRALESGRTDIDRQRDKRKR